MKTLYESILDDEDVLVNKTKDSLNGSLIELYRIYQETGDLKKNGSNTSKLVSGIIDEIKLSKYTTQIREDSICVYDDKYQRDQRDGVIKSHGIINPKYLLFIIRFDRDDYINKRGAKLVMIELGSQRLKRHMKAMEEFAKKNNMELSPFKNRWILW
jgi:hypothetical protein